MKIPSAYCEFQPIEEVLVGRCFPPTLFEKSKGLAPETKYLIRKLLEETEEDYQNLSNVIKNYGAKVYRPTITEDDFSNRKLAKFNSPSAFMNPRDYFITLDDTIYISGLAEQHLNWWLPLLKDYRKNLQYTKAWMNGPSIVRLGDTVIVDMQVPMGTAKRIQQTLAPKGYNVIVVQTHDFPFKSGSAHADGCFAILKPGVILSIYDETQYTGAIFPGWDVCVLKGESWDKMSNWNRKYKRPIQGENYWFTDKEFDDSAFQFHIETWFKDWVGYAAETVFDINVFSLDEHNVLVTSYNEKAFKFFKKHKIEPTIVPFRHRYFWDGGLHCITSDIKRAGNREVYL